MTNETKYEPSPCGSWQAVDRREDEGSVDWRVQELKGGRTFWVTLTRNGDQFEIHRPYNQFSPDYKSKLGEYLSGLE